MLGVASMLLTVASAGMVSAHASDCKVKVFKGMVFHFVDSPFKYVNVADHGSNGAEFFPEGVLMVDCEGKVMAVGAYEDYAEKIDQLRNKEVSDYTGQLIMPGFIDMHVHLPQETMIASYGASLLPWLDEYVFATEATFHDPEVASKLSKQFITDLLSSGTTTAAIHDTIHKVAVEAAFNAAKDRNMRVIVGKIGMDRCRYGGFYPGNTSPPLCDTADSFYYESKELIEIFLRAEEQEQSRVMYAVTPRFAPSSTQEQLARAGQLLEEYSDKVYMQTHLSENFDEIALVRAMYGNLTPSGSQDPYQGSYLEVYDHFGLLGKKSIFAHALHLSESDWQLMAKKGGVVGHCPTSNLFLGSGLFNFRAANQSGVRFGVGSDVGAGTALDTFSTLNEAYKVSILGSTWLSSVMPTGGFPNGIKIFDSDVLCPEVYESPQGCCGCAKKEVGPTSMPAPENNVQPNDFALNAAQAFYLATLGGAEALSLQDRIGSFRKGNEADFVVIDLTANPLESLRIAYLKQTEKWGKLWETLFSLMTLGDRTNIVATYLMGSLAHAHPKPILPSRRCCYDRGCAGTDCDVEPDSCARDAASCSDCGGAFCSGDGNTVNTTSRRKRFADLIV